MKFYLRMFAIVFLASSMLISCQQQPKDKTSGSSKEGTVIATVNGVPVTAEEVKSDISQLPEKYQELATTGEGLTSILDDVMKREMLYQEAKKQNIDKSEDYRSQLHELEKRLIVKILLTKEVEDKTTVTDEEAKKFYDDNPDWFVPPSAPGSKEKKEPVPFEQAKDLIKDRLLQQKQRKAFQDYVDNLSKTYTVELKKDAITKAFGISVGEKTGEMENSTGNSGEEPSGENPDEQNVPETKSPEKTK